ncbi:hypothetical protein EHP00_192 [Ecytonucleospora hepatopenaei]|uniref:Uncharacterized protein n=1 Tax=Ecytonucleospora hepatopenaei TaxID=646526 RepID=A0A1W0E6E1_9MICR|nr:hypothetical protein EHP00_192 [Ecytonucleospora hepatopenaei]
MPKNHIKEIKKAFRILLDNEYRNPFQIYVDGSFLKVADRLQNGTSIFLNLFPKQPNLFITKCEFKKYTNFKKSEKLGDLSGHVQIINCECENDSCHLNLFNIKKENKHHYIIASCSFSILKKCVSSNICTITFKNSIPILNVCNLRRKDFDKKGAFISRGELQRLENRFNK